MAVATRSIDSLRPVRAVVVGVVGVHLVYPVAAAVAVSVWPGSSGSAYTSAALVALPLIFLVMALVIGPLAWRTWHGSRIAPWPLLAFTALETWLYWNGSRAPSWRAEPSDANRFALVMCALHLVASIALLAVAVSREIALVRRRP